MCTQQLLRQHYFPFTRVYNRMSRILLALTNLTLGSPSCYN